MQDETGLNFPHKSFSEAQIERILEAFDTPDNDDTGEWNFGDAIIECLKENLGEEFCNLWLNNPNHTADDAINAEAEFEDMLLEDCNELAGRFMKELDPIKMQLMRKHFQ